MMTAVQGRMARPTGHGQAGKDLHSSPHEADRKNPSITKTYKFGTQVITSSVGFSTFFEEVAAEGNFKNVEWAYNVGVEKDLLDRVVLTKALLAATRNKHVAIVKMICRNSHTLISGDNIHSISPFFYAILNRDYNIVEELCDYGANVNQPLTGGFTPLQLASLLGFCDIAELLIDKGAIVSEQKKSQWTALNLAKAGGHKQLVSVLKQKKNPKKQISSISLPTSVVHTGLTRINKPVLQTDPYNDTSQYDQADQYMEYHNYEEAEVQVENESKHSGEIYETIPETKGNHVSEDGQGDEGTQYVNFREIQTYRAKKQAGEAELAGYQRTDYQKVITKPENSVTSHQNAANFGKVPHSGDNDDKGGTYGNHKEIQKYLREKDETIEESRSAPPKSRVGEDIDTKTPGKWGSSDEEARKNSDPKRAITHFDDPKRATKSPRNMRKIQEGAPKEDKPADLSKLKPTAADDDAPLIQAGSSPKPFKNTPPPTLPKPQSQPQNSNKYVEFPTKEPSETIYQSMSEDMQCVSTLQSPDLQLLPKMFNELAQGNAGSNIFVHMTIQQASIQCKSGAECKVNISDANNVAVNGTIHNNNCVPEFVDSSEESDESPGSSQVT